MAKMTGDRAPESALVSAHGNTSARGHFYEKMRKLNESSRLSFVFNFRHTTLDLYHLYEEVVQRGGFYQVTKLGRWDDVASALNLRSTKNASTAQLQSIYETLLLQYELLYYCNNIPRESKPWPDYSQGFCLGVSSSYLTGKRKYRDLNDLNGKEDVSKPTVAPGQMVSEIKYAGHQTMHDSSTIIEFSNSTVEEFVEMPDAPLKPRTGYLIFLRLETQRLKKIHGQSCRNLREMVTQAWKSLTDEGKQPYIEASRMDKERYMKEMAAFEELLNNHGAKSKISASNPTSIMTSFSESAEISALIPTSTMTSFSTAAETLACNPTSTMTSFSKAAELSASNPISIMTSFSKAAETSAGNPTSTITSFSKAVETSVGNLTPTLTSFSKAAEISPSNLTSTMTSFSKAAETDEVYHVSSKADSDDLISPDDSMVELAMEVMKNAQSNDPMSHWDCGSLED